VAATNQAQVRNSGHGDRLDSGRRERLSWNWLAWDRLARNRLARNRLARNRLDWDRLDWDRLDWDRLDWGRLDWGRRQRLSSVRCDWLGSGCGLRLHSGGWQRLGCVR
jgi:hypothetical protein